MQMIQETHQSAVLDTQESTTPKNYTIIEYYRTLLEVFENVMTHTDPWFLASPTE